jgi:hypothetical protein
MSGGLPAFCKVMDRSSTTGTTRLVLLAIASYAQRDGTGAWPSRGAIQHRAGVGSLRTVDRHIDKLVESGELEVTYKAGTNGCNLYRIACAADSASDVDTAISTSDVDTAMSRSAHNTSNDTSTSAASDVDTAMSRDVDTAVSPEQEEQELEQDVSPPPSAGGGETRVSADTVHRRLAEFLPVRDGQLEAVREALEEFPGVDLAEVLQIAAVNGRDLETDGVGALRVVLRYTAAKTAGESKNTAWPAALVAEGVEECS